MITAFRDLVRDWEEKEILWRVKREVSPQFELGALVKCFRGKQPLYFENVRGYSAPVVAGMGGDRELLAKSMGIDSQQMISHMMQAIVHPIPTRLIDRASVHENVILKPNNLQEIFPVMTYHEFDSGPYFVSGVLVVKGSNGLDRYTSIRRMKLLSGGRTNIVITSPELLEQFLTNEANGQPMEVAIMFGVVPAVIVSSQISTHLFHIDKLNVAGGLLRKALEVVKCKTVDLEVLADTEIVVEGRMVPGVREMEEPFAELGGYYGAGGLQPTIEITAITYRNHPIVQTIMPASEEEKLPMALAREMVLYQTVRQVVPHVREVHITMGGVARFHAIISIDKRSEGDGKQAALAAFASDKDLKHVIVVNDDVNIHDPEEVEWAVATRMQADQDVFIIPGGKGSPLEASHNLRGVSAKMGIDATYPLAAAHLFRRTRVPGEHEIDVNQYFEFRR